MNRSMPLKTFTFLIVLALVSSPLGWAEKMNALEPEVIRTLEHSSGQVTGIDAQSIDLLYARTEDAEYEMHLPVDAKVELKHYKAFSDIQRGDEVELQYEKVVETPNTPTERMTMTVKTIRFIKRPKEGELRSEEKK